MSALAKPLVVGLDQLGLQLSAPRQAQLLDYLALLGKWNRVYNLTAVRHPDAMLNRHLLDSLTVLPHVHGSRLLDIGSGAGLPGMVLAIVRPDLHVTLLDGNGKKTRFCLQVKAELKLDNVEVVHARYGEYQPDQGFDTLTARAFGSLQDLVENALALALPGARLLAMKGHYPYAEIDALDDATHCLQALELAVPGLDAERHLIIVDLDCAGRGTVTPRRS